MRGGGGDCLTFSRHLAQVQGTITWPRRRTEEPGAPLNIDLLIKARKAAQLHANSIFQSGVADSVASASFFVRPRSRT